jgi:hypothetical protein
VPTLWSLPPRHAPAVPPSECHSGATAGEPKCLPAGLIPKDPDLLLPIN